MTTDFNRQAMDSKAAFKYLIWPALSRCYGGGEGESIEFEPGDVAKLLDIYAGIDAFQVMRDQGCIRGIANRTQFKTDAFLPGWPYCSFTIRKQRNGRAVELEKRIHAIQNRDQGFLYPHLTSQGYIDRNALIIAGGVETVRLIEFVVRHGVDSFREVRNPADQDTTFIVTYWHELREDGIDVTVVDGGGIACSVPSHCRRSGRCEASLFGAMHDRP